MSFARLQRMLLLLLLACLLIASWPQMAPEHNSEVLATSTNGGWQTNRGQIQAGERIPDAMTLAESPPSPPTAMVFLDPGHGGVDSGTTGTAYDGTVVEEKDVALALAIRTANLLRADGISVVLSRTDDSLPGATSSDFTDDGTVLTESGVVADLQRRIELANASGAQVLLSIHFNAFDDSSISGTQTLYDGSRPFADRSLRLATLIQDNVIAALWAQGYATPDRGVTDDQELLVESLGSLHGYDHLILLGPAIPRVLSPSNMPGALVETFFLSNPAEASAIVDPGMQDLIARAFATGIEEFLRE